MLEQSKSWLQWKLFFEARSTRALPDLQADRDYHDVPQSVARSLAIFQLGESGGGTVISQARQSKLRGLNSHYGRAVDLFVKEEHRHANILALCIRLLGGELIKKNWTANLFVFSRRLIGLRMKVVVLLAAEVVGLCYYHLLATHLPDSKLRSQLLEIVADERAHLEFHCDFLRTQTQTRLRRLAFLMTWRCVMSAAMLVVAFDHRHAIRDMGIALPTVKKRWSSYSRLAERQVSDTPPAAGASTAKAPSELKKIGDP